MGKVGKIQFFTFLMITKFLIFKLFQLCFCTDVRSSYTLLQCNGVSVSSLTSRVKLSIGSAYSNQGWNVGKISGFVAELCNQVISHYPAKISSYFLMILYWAGCHLSTILNEHFGLRGIEDGEGRGWLLKQKGGVAKGGGDHLNHGNSPLWHSW